MDLSFGDILLSEILGTAALTLLGCGVVANAILTKNKGFGGGFLMINFGWGFAVMVGILLAAKSGAHLNPAVTLGFLAAGNPGDLSFSNVVAYLCGEFIGAFIGAVLCWAAYKDHFDEEADPGAKLGVFSTGPAIRNTASNLITEIIGTFVLVFGILSLSQKGNAVAGGLGFLTVSFIVVGIGASLGGPTGYAINPARDLGPRIAHFLLPIKGKGDSDWAYSWIPVAGPIIGGVIGGLLANWVNYV
ncbi:MAG TPA: MIP/aquaporin family protein [Nocardioidaceae bacterium]|nr:MIP/aquaporin family protein [Nocardioidaceae bacterium]